MSFFDVYFTAGVCTLWDLARSTDRSKKKGDATQESHLVFPLARKWSNLILKASGQRTRIAFFDGTQSTGGKTAFGS